MEAHLAIRIEAATLERLQKLAKVKDRPVSWLVRKAIDELLDREQKHGS